MKTNIFYEKKMRDYLLRVFEYFHLLQNMLFPMRSSSSISSKKRYTKRIECQNKNK